MSYRKDHRLIADKFTEIIGSHLHYFENMGEIDLSTCSAKDITDLQEKWVGRYQNDVLFHNKVQSTVADLLHVLLKIEEKE